MFDAFNRILVEARLRSSSHREGFSHANMMGDVVNYRPRCCGCKRLAVGRICYMNGQEKVVDNPFCDLCYNEVYKQTLRLIRTLYADVEMASEWIWAQKWHLYQPIPSLPSGLPEIVKNGERISKDESL